jgi:hypothetical protein
VEEREVEWRVVALFEGNTRPLESFEGRPRRCVLGLHAVLNDLHFYEMFFFI